MRADDQKPRIGITGPAKRLAPGRIASCLAVRRAGGRPVCLAPGRREPDESLAAIIVTGGSDIDPLLYGGPPEPFSPPDVIRDEFELAALRFADLHGLPVLGICRGAQLMNVHHGGSLHADVAHLRRVTSNKASLTPSKTVDVEPHSVLASLLGTHTLRVNSLHHQAVDRIGEGLRVVARDRDKLVQGIESTDHRFRLGVQWHPEYLAFRETDMQLFRGLVAAASRA